MRGWVGIAMGIVVGGVAVAALLGRGALVPSAHAQYLSTFQNVDVDFETTGAISTLTFFDRDSGDTYIYIASGTGQFQFTRKLSMKDLGGPLAAELATGASNLPKLQTGIE